MPKYLINKFQTIQNRAARIITNSDYDQPSEPICKSLHWLSVGARIEYNIATYVHKALHNKAQLYIKDLFEISARTVIFFSNLSPMQFITTQN